MSFENFIFPQGLRCQHILLPRVGPLCLELDVLRIDTNTFTLILFSDLQQEHNEESEQKSIGICIHCLKTDSTWENDSKKN
jgi:hypothetical protein